MKICFIFAIITHFGQLCVASQIFQTQIGVPGLIEVQANTKLKVVYQAVAEATRYEMLCRNSNGDKWSILETDLAFRILFNPLQSSNKIFDYLTCGILPIDANGQTISGQDQVFQIAIDNSAISNIGGF